MMLGEEKIHSNDNNDDDDGDSNGDVIDDNIGTRVASFYLSLRTIQSSLGVLDLESEKFQSDLLALVHSLELVETFKYFNNNTTESTTTTNTTATASTTSTSTNDNVIDEIVDDCRKKISSFFIALYADRVTSLVTSSRKKITSKTAIRNTTNSSSNNNSSNSNQHGQRHFNTLVELLGLWSNYIAEMIDLGLSTHTLSLILAPLHVRVIVLAQECFIQFKEDKKLDNWHMRINNNSNNNISNDNNTSDVSILALDFLLSQMAAMREVVNHYYNFLALHDITIGSSEELNKWRELDAVYIALEYGYLTHAVDDAIGEINLLDIESGTVYVPQAVEDFFFLLLRVAERAISTGSSHSILAVGNKIIEFLDPANDYNIYTTITSKTSFRGVKRNKTINFKKSQEQPNSPVRANAGSSNSHKSINNSNHTNDNGSNSVSIVDNNNANSNNNNNNISSSSSSSGGPFSLLGGVASLIETLIFDDDTNANAAPSNNNTNNTQSSSSLSALVSFERLDELILNALEDELNAIDDDDSNSLNYDDLCVYLVTLGVASISVKNINQNFIDTFNKINSSSNGSSSSSSSSSSDSTMFTIITSELSRCAEQYDSNVHEAVKEFVDKYFMEKLTSDITSSLAKTYDINGETMDRRSGDNELARVVRACIGVGGYAYDKIKAHVSMHIFTEICQQLKTIIISIIKDKILSSSYSEWGALLLHEEVLCMINVFDDIDDNDNNNRVIFDPLTWMLKILTIDQPADLLRYRIPGAYVDDGLARQIMASRVDLSKDAIARVKINIES